MFPDVQAHDFLAMAACFSSAPAGECPGAHAFAICPCYIWALPASAPGFQEGGK